MKKLTLSIQEVANVLGVSRPTVYKLAQMSDFPAFHLRGRVVISADGLERWVEVMSRKGVGSNIRVWLPLTNRGVMCTKKQLKQ